MIDVSELMTDPELSRTFTVRRPRGEFANEGEFTSSYKDTLIRGVVQQAKPNDLKFLPEGTRIDDILSVWSAEEMRGGDGKTQEPDVLLIDGAYFKVIRAEPRPDGGYWRVFVQGYIPS